MEISVLIKLFLAVVTPVIAEMPMKFTKVPESVTAPVGDTVVFECSVKVPGERLAWRRRNADSAGEEWGEVESGSNDKEKLATTTKLSVHITEETRDEIYQCVVWYGAVSLASVPARLTIAKLVRPANPQRRVLSVHPGNTVVLHCKEPVSKPPAELAWLKDNKMGAKQQLEAPFGVLVLHNVTYADSGSYICTAINEFVGQTTPDVVETTFLNVQTENRREARFLEPNEHLGKVENSHIVLQLKVNSTLRLWCGAVGNPPPRVTWTNPKGEVMATRRDQVLILEPFTAELEGIYSCSINSAPHLRRSWKVEALEPPSWKYAVANVNVSEGDSAHVACGTALGHPTPSIHWLLNAEPLKSGRGIKSNGSDLYIDNVQKKHAGIVQCFACNDLGCAYDAALLTVVPMQISGQEYPPESSQMNYSSQPPRRHNSRKKGKHKGKKMEMDPPSKPNVTRMSDESVMVTWTHSNHGLPIQFYKIQYREVNDSAPSQQWSTAIYEIPSHIHSYEIDQLKPDRYYKFRIAAVYSNQDNKLGKSSAKFYLRRGGFPEPSAPTLVNAVPLSPNSIKLEWTWSSEGGVQAAGFYAYYRASTTAGSYEKMTVPGGAHARSVVLSHLNPDTSYELKLQAYTEEAPSEFSSILVARTHKSSNAPGTSTEAAPEDVKNDGRAPGALVTAGGALGAAALLVILVVTLLLCRRAKRPPANKEKGSAPESGGANNGYIPAKVPITITANPMHAEGGDGAEMSFLHNNNTGNDDTLPHSRKNGPARQYV